MQRYWELLPLEPPYFYQTRDDGQAIEIAMTPCTYGGERRWFVCPGCQRRCGVLYRPGRWWMCRRCARLTYWTQRHDRPTRLQHRVDKLERRLGLHRGPMRRPKGMHQRTYQRLQAQWWQAYQAADAAREDQFLLALMRYQRRFAPELERLKARADALERRINRSTK